MERAKVGTRLRTSRTGDRAGGTEHRQVVRARTIKQSVALQEVTMTLGPLEYTVIGFEGNRFNGEIAKEIEKVVEKRIIRLVDVVFITKDIDGEVAVVEIDNKADPRFAGFAPMLQDLMGLLTPEDVVAIGDGLPKNTSALVLLFEHRWAEKIKDAMGAAGGFLISRNTIPPEVLELVNAELEAATA
jgi:uncharacterized membrane protein